MFKKRFPLLYRLCILQLIIRGFALGRSSMIFLGLLNVIVLYFFLPQVKSWIDRQVRYVLIDGLHMRDTQLNEVRDGIKNVVQKYVMIFSLIYILVAVFDFFFANILFLSIWGGIFFFLISLLICWQDVVKGIFRLGERKLGLSDLIWMISAVLLFSLLVFLRGLPFYQNYFYSIGISFVVRIALTMMLQTMNLKKIIYQDIFLLGVILSTVFFVVYLRHSFPEIKDSMTIQETVYQTGTDYIDCPINLSGTM
ncbi:MAG: hypothetical protein NTX91_05110 [candidate division SR1 bacterium]|nr:hypothetical protein [candidate division SR1 bacterium]